MRRLLFPFFAFLLSFPAYAAPSGNYSFAFDSVQLNELARVVYSDVLGKSYIFDSDFLQDRQAIGFTLKNATKDEVRAALQALLDRHGFHVIEGKILEVLKKEQDRDGQEVFYYKPKYRSVNYITDLVSALFDKGRFSTMRQLKSAPADSVAGYSSASKQTQDSGTSAFSMMDKEKDAFIFQGSAGEIDKLRNLLVQVDVSAGQILVRAHVFEVTTGVKEGSAFSLAVDLLGARFSLGQFKDLGNSLRLTKGGIDVAYSALASDSRFKVVSSPSLRVKSGENARFSVGSDVPVLGAVQLDKNGNPVQSVEYKPSGVILDLKPRIRGEEIELNISQQLSSFVSTTTGVNNSPTLIKREIQTSVGVSDGDLVILGGLDESRTSDDSSGLPFLPKFLRSNGHEDSKTELLLILETQKI